MSQSVEGIVYKVVIDPSTGIAQLKQFDRATLETERNTRKAAAGIEGALGKASKSTSGLTGKATDLDGVLNKIRPSSLLAAAGIGALAASAGVAVTKTRQFLAMGQEAMNVTAAFNTLSKNAGLLGQDIVEEMKRGTRGLVDDTDMMRSVNEALLQDLPITAKNAGMLADSMTKLGRAIGLDAGEAIDRFLAGTARMQERQLKMIGISVDQERVFNALAVSLKKPVAELTEAEQRTAFFTAALEDAVEKASRAPEPMLTVSDSITQVGVAFKNTSEEIASSANKPETWSMMAAMPHGPGSLGSLEAMQRVRDQAERAKLGPAMGYEIRPPETRIPDVAPVPGDWARSKLKIPSAYDTRLMIDALRVAVVETNLLRDAAREAGNTDAFKILTTQLAGLNEQLDEAQKKAGLLREPLAKIQAGPAGLPSVPFVDAITATRGIHGTPTDIFSPAASAGVRSQMIAEPAMDMIAGPAAAGILDLRAVLDEARASSAALVYEFEMFGTVVPIAIAEGLPVVASLVDQQAMLANEILRGAAAGAQFSPAMVQQAQDVYMLAEAYRAVQYEAMTFEGQMWSLITGSVAWGGAMASMQNSFGMAGQALISMGGSFARAGKAVQKVQAMMLLVEGIKGVKAGAIKVWEGMAIGPGAADPKLIASGAGMIATGLQAIAQAKALGASGGGSGGGAPAGAGGGGSSAAASYPTYVGKGGVEAGSGTSQRYANPRETGGAVVNHHWSIQALDSKSFDQFLSDPAVRSRIYELVSSEAK